MIVDFAKNHLKEISALISPIAVGSLIYASDLREELKKEISEYVSPLLQELKREISRYASPLLQTYNSLSPNEQLFLVAGSCLLGIGIGYRIKSNKDDKKLEKKLTRIDERLGRLEGASKNKVIET